MGSKYDFELRYLKNQSAHEGQWWLILLDFACSFIWAQLVLSPEFPFNNFGPVQKAIQYNVNNAWGNESDLTGLELVCLHYTGSIFVLVSQKQHSLESKRVTARFPSKSWGWSTEQHLFTLGVEHSRNLSDMEGITFGIETFQLVII